MSDQSNFIVGLAIVAAIYIADQVLCHRTMNRTLSIAERLVQRASDSDEPGTHPAPTTTQEE